MKIIQLIQKRQRRGAEIFAAQLSEQLALSGHAVLLISIFEGDAELPFEGEWIKLNRPISNRFFDFRGWRTFSKIVEEFQPDLIQANAADTLKFSVFSKLLFGWGEPIIYRNANQMGDFIMGKRHKKFNQFLLNQVSGVISVSEASRRDFHRTFIFPVDKSTCIPIGIDVDEIDTALQENLAVELPKNFIIQVGGLVPEKNPIGMLIIFQDLVEKLPGIHLVFLGAGSLEAEISREVKGRGLGKVVHFISPQSNIFPILYKAKALVIPSKIEGLPAVIVEAMYCGVPVVAYDVGGISEILGKTTGWLIPVDDADGFKSALMIVLNLSDSERNRITLNARNTVSDFYTIESIATKFEKYYEK